MPKRQSAAARHGASCVATELPAELVLQIAQHVRAVPLAVASIGLSAAARHPWWQAPCEPDDAPCAPVLPLRLVCRSWRDALDGGVRSIMLVGPTGQGVVLVPARFPMLTSIDARMARCVTLPHATAAAHGSGAAGPLPSRHASVSGSSMHAQRRLGGRLSTAQGYSTLVPAQTSSHGGKGRGTGREAAGAGTAGVGRTPRASQAAVVRNTSAGFAGSSSASCSNCQLQHKAGDGGAAKAWQLPGPSHSHRGPLMPGVTTLSVDLALQHQELSCACPNVRQLAVTFSGRTFPQLSRALTGLLRGMPHITTLLLTWQDLTQFSVWSVLSGLESLTCLFLEGCSCPWFLAPQFGGGLSGSQAAAEEWMRCFRGAAGSHKGAAAGAGAGAGGEAGAGAGLGPGGLEAGRAPGASSSPVIALPAIDRLSHRLEVLSLKRCTFQAAPTSAPPARALGGGARGMGRGRGGRQRRNAVMGAEVDAAAAAAAAWRAAAAVWHDLQAQGGLGNLGAAGEAGDAAFGMGRGVGLDPQVLLSRVFVQSVQRLRGLVHLDLSSNVMQSVNEGFGALSQLQTLNLSCNKLSTLPPSTSLLTSLKSLDLSHNHVEAVPPVLQHMTGLQELNLGRNWLNGSTLHRLSSLHQLHSLDISYVFSMPHFPPELCELTALRTLVVKCVYVHSIPSEFSRLSNLTSLDISFNSEMDTQEVNKMLSPLRLLRSLCMNHLDLEVFPEVLLDLSHLTCLELGRNRFAQIPHSISRLTQLQVLNLQGAYACRHGPHLCEVAPSLYTMTNLRVLSLGCNFSGKLPAGISSLVNLDTLSLSMNCLLRLPPGLEQLSALSRLDLRHNQLRQAPGALTQLKGLRRLAIHGNPLSRTALATLTAYLDKQGCRLMP